MKSRTQKYLVLFASSLVVLIYSQNCSMKFETPLSGTTVSSSLSLQGGTKLNPFVCATPTQSVNPLLRLTKAQYSNTLLDLVGANVQGQVVAKVNTLYSDVLLKSVVDFTNTISDTQMTSYQSIAEAVYMVIKGDNASLEALGTSCITQATVAASCRDAFIQNAGLHAYRRPLTTAEVSSIATKVYALGTGSADSAALVIYKLLLAPDFLLHLELGDTSTADASVYKITPYEVASRISYGLTDGPPDSALYAAAAGGNLTTLSQVQTQVDRLLQSPNGRAKVRNFFTFWLDPQRYNPSIFAADFLQGFDVASANEEYSRELFEYVEYMIYTKKASFNDLITSRESFARTPAVAQVYGHAAVTGDKPAQTSGERMGLFMRGPVIATEGNETHPIKRGVKFRNRFLCETLGLPSGVMTNDPTFFSDAARTVSSTRIRTAGITQSTSCMGCHSQINPIGFAFENFDGLGRTRAVERAFSVSGTFLATHPVITDSPSVFLSGENVGVKDGVDFIKSMTATNQLPGCFVKQLHRFYSITPETQEDACQFKDIYSKVILDNPNAPAIDAFRYQFISNTVFQRRMQ